MAVQVSFLTPGGAGPTNTPIVGEIRIRESLAIPATTTASAQNGEIAMIYNGETGAVWVAHGATPDAATSTATGASSAGVTVPPGDRLPIALKVGSKVNVKVVV